MSTELRIKSELLKGAQPFAFDFGGSALKLVYITSDPNDEAYSLVKGRSFSRFDLDKALELIKAEVVIPKGPGSDPPSFLMTGVGMHQYGNTVEEKLNIRCQIVWEHGCCSEAFMFLMKHLPEEQLFHPCKYTKDEKWHKLKAEMAHFLKAIGGLQEEEISAQPFVPREWPCLLVTLGSTFVARVIEEDEKEKQVHFSSRGGKMFMGLGSLLTNAKTYEELIELAKEGNDHSVHTYTSDLNKQFQKQQEDDSAYSQMDFDANVFSFGWAPGKSITDFPREDLARASLSLTIEMFIEDLHKICSKEEVTNVVLNGGFVTDPFVKDLLDQEFHKGLAAESGLHPGDAAANASCRTLIFGIYLGALGALLQSIPSEEPKG